ncbi:hypothetical protein [Sphingobium amiense]|uniref:hypothetical protein n=1 Tax=Sphingobium amiense TaxID=135719 RepID=UPI0011AE30D3|nr:hypothetical protein [Sphingobium amiense]
MNDFSFYDVHGAYVATNTEPPPTCPFINQQCQRTFRQGKADNLPPPILAFRGTGVRLCRRPSIQHLDKGSVPSGEAAYMEGFADRQTLFAILFQKILKGSALDASAMMDRMQEKTDR